MANFMFNAGKEAILGATNLLTADIKACAIDLADWTPNAATDEDLADVPGAAIVATSANLTGKTVTDGRFDADNFVLPSVTGDQFEAILYYVDTGTPATSVLLALIDTNSDPAPISITPDGNNVNVTINGFIFSFGTPA